MGVRLQPGDRFGEGSGAALRVRSRVPVADRAGGSELPHAGGFPRGETEGIGRTVYPGSGRSQQGGSDHPGAGDAGRDEDPCGGQPAKFSMGEHHPGTLGTCAAACGGDGRSSKRRGRSESETSACPSAAGTAGEVGKRPPKKGGDAGGEGPEETKKNRGNGS